MRFLQSGDHKLDLTQTQVMGIVNMTPDSFSGVGRFDSTDQALRHVHQMFQDGASIIDVGGEPTNPQVHPFVEEQQELDRIMPLIVAIKRELPVWISVDTSKPGVMRAAIAEGVHIINDVRALMLPYALEEISRSSVAVCLMYMKYPDGKTLGQKDEPAEPIEIISTVYEFLKNRVSACVNAGINLSRLLIDPGIGHGNFGKSSSENAILLNRLSRLKELDLPILVGVSRKTFIGEILGLAVSDRLYGSLAASVLAVCQGAAVIRTHDVKATVEAVKVATYCLSAC